MGKTSRLNHFLCRGLLLLCMELLITSSIWGNNLYGQQSKIISVSLKNVTLLHALEHLTNVVGCEILYNHEQVKSDKKFSLDVTNKPLEEVLRKCLENTNLTYKIVDNVFVLTNKAPENDTEKVKEFTGVVIDAKGDSIPGVTVMIKGTSMGASTDMRGVFKLKIPANIKDITLVFSFIGMETQEIKAGIQTTFRVILQEKKENLEEIVVTGIANINKKSFTGSAVTIKKEELLKASKTSVVAALQTFDPSFRMEQSNLFGSDPNRVPDMYVRGRTGIGVKELDENSLKNNPNLPTFILDGIEVSAQKIYDMDPDRIESITILKDAAATAMYGSRASNGVIVVTSVAPKAGEINVTYILNGGITMPSLKDYNLMNSAEKLEVERLAGLYDDELYQDDYYERLGLIAEGVDTDWLAKPLRNTFNQKHTLRIEGGHNDFRYALDGSYYGNNGVMKDSYRNTLSVGLTLDYRLKEHLQIVNMTEYSSMNAEDSPYGNLSDYTGQNPYNKITDEHGNMLKNLQYQNQYNNMNPLYDATLNNYSRTNYEYVKNNLKGIWYVTDGLRAEVTLGVTKQWDGSRRFEDPRSLKAAQDTYDQEKGKLFLSSGIFVDWQVLFRLAYNKSFGKHNVNATLAYDLLAKTTTSESSEYRGFPSGDLDSPAYAAKIFEQPTFTDDKKRSIGYVATVNYTYNNIYLMDASLRFDASSEFGENSRIAPFGSAGLGINLHNYSFMQGAAPWLSQLKLRTSYGQTGHANFQPYVASTIYENNLDHWYSTGYGATLRYLGNKDLTWEKTNKFSAAVELDIKDGLFYLSAEYFNDQTVDMITPVTIPTSSGFNVYQDNMGKNEKKGYTLNMRSDFIRTKDWHVALSANLEHSRSKIKEVSESLKAYNEKVNDFYDTDSNHDEWSTPLMQYEEGQSLTAIWGCRSLGIDPATGNEMFINRDGNITYDWNAQNQVVIGDEEPDARGSINLNLSYKGFSLFASFLYEFGGDMYNQTLVDKVEDVNIKYNNADKRVLTDRWRKPGDIAKFKKLNTETERPTRPTSRFVQENNFLELSSLSLSYNFSDHEWLQKSFLNSLRLDVSMENIWRLASIKQERGLHYPFANTVNFTLRLGF